MDADMRILHTANAGVLINIGRNALGIDLFSKDPEELYPDTPEDLKNKLLEQIGRGEIQSLLFTHEHGDHFCLPDVLEALRRNPELLIISTEEVIRKIREMTKYAGKMHVISKDETETVKINIPGFSTALFNSMHQGEEYADIQNLTCMLEAGGKKLLVPGDAWPKPELFARVREWSEHIDWMLTPFPLIGLPSVRRMIDKDLRIEHILALHLPRPEKDAQNWIANTKAVCARAKDGLPMPVFAESLGTEYILHKDSVV